MGWPDTQPFSHAWGPVRWRQLLAASQGIAAFSACCSPQISHMLLRLFERCEPDTSRPASATLTAILQHPPWVRLTLSTGRPSCAPCIVVGARRCGAITTTQTTILQHPAGVPHTLHWPPRLRTLHYCRCTALWGNYHNSDDNSPASSRGSADTLRWLPNLGRTDSHRSTSMEVAEVQGDLASASLRIQVGAYRSGRRCLCTWHNWN